MKKRCLSGFVAVFFSLSGCSDLPLDNPVPLPAPFPLFEDFEAGTLDGWHPEAASDTSVSILAPPAAMTGSGTRALRCLVIPQDAANHGNRAELARYQVAQFGDDVYYGWDLFVPLEDPDDYGWQIVAQFYQLPDFKRGETFDFWFIHPPVTLVLEPGKLVLMGNVPSEKRLAETAFTKGVTHRIFLHVRPTDGEGLVELWLDSVSILSGATAFRGPTLWNKAGAYLKLGLYRGAPGQTQAPSSNSLWIDNVKMSRTRAEVL